MIPIQKVKDIVIRHDDLEKELSSGKIDPKLFSKNNALSMFSSSGLAAFFHAH